MTHNRPRTRARMRALVGARCVIATHNEGKRREMEALLRPYGVACVAAGALNLDAPEETGATFAENAALKARWACAQSGSVALADDSGLVVDALEGAPGVLSARWAGEERDFTLAMRRLEAAWLARKTDNARARFISALALAFPDRAPGSAPDGALDVSDAALDVSDVRCDVFEGVVEGAVVFPPRGAHGFGYDPVFRPEGHTRTFGEMTPEQKDALSHRSRAFAKLAAHYFGEA